MARHPGEDALYARDLGFMEYRASERVTRLGGAQKLRKIDDAARRLLMAKTGPVPQSLGLERRGMKVGTSLAREAQIERQIQRLLMERGLAQ